MIVMLSVPRTFYILYPVTTMIATILGITDRVQWCRSRHYYILLRWTILPVPLGTELGASYDTLFVSRCIPALFSLPTCLTFDFRHDPSLDPAPVLSGDLETGPPFDSAHALGLDFNPTLYLHRAPVFDFNPFRPRPFIRLSVSLANFDFSTVPSSYLDEARANPSIKVKFALYYSAIL
ncbi:hypothetical protein EVAR_75295_1 [Eumeta japonica]|uniref:Uncharacterized protein n=1 Tax=Eumeta variegata TaxID=151549 RepID=A0A4C1YYA6_EUMVA|nr:hypothetical protein EVAR_75295_1 [Eumeta japonica]